MLGGRKVRDRELEREGGRETETERYSDEKMLMHERKKSFANNKYIKLLT